MPRLTFGDSFRIRVLTEDNLEADEDGYVVNAEENERVTDAFGKPVGVENVGGIIPLTEHGMSVNSEGRVVDANGDLVSENFDDDGYKHTEAIVPISDTKGILRSGFTNTSDFTDAKRVNEEPTE